MATKSRVNLADFLVGRNGVKPVYYAKIYLIGAPGSGKTRTAAIIANRIIKAKAPGKRILFLDTDSGASAKAMSDEQLKMTDIIVTRTFDHMDIASLFQEMATDPQYAQNYGVVVWDNHSDYWNKTFDSAKASGDSGWVTVAPWRKMLKDAISTFPTNLIVTAQAKNKQRSVIKTEVKIGEGKQAKVVNITGDPIQEPEFSGLFDIGLTLHDGGTAAVVSKTRYSQWSTRVERPLLIHRTQFEPITRTGEFAEQYISWMDEENNRFGGEAQENGGSQG